MEKEFNQLRSPPSSQKINKEFPQIYIRRPKNVMTPGDRLLLRKQRTVRLGDAISEEDVSHLKNEIRKGTLLLIEEKIEQLKQDIEEKSDIIRNHRKQIFLLTQALRTEEQDLRITKRSLFSAEREYERAKRQFNT